MISFTVAIKRQIATILVTSLFAS